MPYIHHYQKDYSTDLEGRKVGGVVLSRKIGSGAFGDVYISGDFSVVVKILFPQRFPEINDFYTEIRAVSYVSSMVCDYCGIGKYLGGGDVGEIIGTPWYPFRPEPAFDQKAEDGFTKYANYPMVPDYERISSPEKGDPPEYFYYLMAAADNLLDSREDYIPDTLENRYVLERRNRMQEKDKALIIAEILDILFFLYRRPTTGPWHRTPRKKEEQISVTHGDIKPGNIYFSNGHAVLGDFGCTVGINPAAGIQIATAQMMPSPDLRARMIEKCGTDFPAQRILFDLYALGMTAFYLAGDGNINTGKENFGSPLCSIGAELTAIGGRFDCITKDKLVDWMNRFRRNYDFEKKTALSFARYARPAPVLNFFNRNDFYEEWNVVDLLPSGKELVRSSRMNFEGRTDDLTVEFLPENQLESIMEQDARMLHGKDSIGKPVMIYRLLDDHKIAVLRHVSPEDVRRRRRRF